MQDRPRRGRHTHSQFAAEVITMDDSLGRARGSSFGTGRTSPRPCPDVVVASFGVSLDSPASYFGILTPECERLPRLAVVAGHAVVATVVRVEKEPEPNDTPSTTSVSAS